MPQFKTITKKNTGQTQKLPFGLAIACDFASEAIAIRPSNTKQILWNLFELQSSENFPELLTTNYFFKKPTYQLSDIQLKSLEALTKAIQQDKTYHNKIVRKKFLEELFIFGWKDKGHYSKANAYMAFNLPKARSVKNRGKA